MYVSCCWWAVVVIWRCLEPALPTISRQEGKKREKIPSNISICFFSATAAGKRMALYRMLKMPGLTGFQTSHICLATSASTISKFFKRKDISRLYPHWVWQMKQWLQQAPPSFVNIPRTPAWPSREVWVCHPHQLHRTCTNLFCSVTFVQNTRDSLFTLRQSTLFWPWLNSQWMALFWREQQRYPLHNFSLSSSSPTH